MDAMVAIAAMALIVLYFAPAMLAYSRQTRNREQALVVNVFLGWTLLGLVVALTMAMSADREVTK